MAILDNDRARVNALLKAEPKLAASLIAKPRLYQTKIFHWIYAGDTALHLAAAGYRVELVQLLLSTGASPNSATNHRRSTPLHYAADGPNTGPNWDAARQVKALAWLLDAGAHIGAPDKNGATPLHRAVRTRSAAAVKYLLERGADPQRRNHPGSTPFHLAVQNTGRGGSGEQEAIAAQREIIRTFLDHGLSPALKDGHGKSVLDCARSAWIREMLA